MNYMFAILAVIHKKKGPFRATVPQLFAIYVHRSFDIIFFLAWTGEQKVPRAQTHWAVQYVPRW